MGNVTKKILHMLIALAIMAVFIPAWQLKAAGTEGFSYQVTGEKRQYCECADDAFAACYSRGGGVIEICKDVELNFPDYIKYGCTRSNTMLVIWPGVTVTIGKYGFQMDGELKLEGTLDLEHSEGVLSGTGNIDLCGGKLIKRSYTIDRNDEEFCLSGSDIRCGQTLAESDIFEDEINWRAPVEGTWEFANPELVPQVGTRGYDVVFKPKYSMTYEEKVFYQCGRVTVTPIVPVREDYEPWEMYVGETLSEVSPAVSYTDPISGEKLEGVLTFENAGEPLMTLGEQQVKGTFTPKNGNYAAVTEYFRIYVKKAVPQITTEPRIRNQGIYGGTLDEIQFIPGKCSHPTKGTLLEGTWEWQDSSLHLELGTKEYTLLFLPSEPGYEIREFPVQVTTYPKEMGSIEWPECSDLTYGQSLADSELSFYKNEYGTFSWEDGSICPEVENQGAIVVFHPANTEIYDWSKLAGYDPEKHTVSFAIPIRVCPAENELPDVSGEEKGSVSEKKTDPADSVSEPETVGEQATFVITQMVSKVSKIRSAAVTVKKTAWVRTKRSKSRAKLTWKKIKGVRYQIQYGTDRKWKHSRKKTVKKNSVTLRGLKGKKKYYVRIRCVKTKNGKRYYSKWSSMAALAY